MPTWASTCPLVRAPCPTWRSWHAGELAQVLCLADQHLDAAGQSLVLEEKEELAEGFGWGGEDAAAHVVGAETLQ